MLREAEEDVTRELRARRKGGDAAAREASAVETFVFTVQGRSRCRDFCEF